MKAKKRKIEKITCKLLDEKRRKKKIDWANYSDVVSLPGWYWVPSGMSWKDIPSKGGPNKELYSKANQEFWHGYKKGGIAARWQLTH